ncbi:Ig-like domain-containing protein [Gottfriedia acidiceleris]|uniref:Ig-like domain-containing protein n=1 Tax=Gottfriedia acidiceleris TaxID=371036 RepID=A0ABY4JR40_9BACI|nr:Ig-like domain-containing protein [Gottfriedia acidiceleris]UPM56306.1 Ig-like domain-containing protein [Gottfriedia acidiceleris]
MKKIFSIFIIVFMMTIPFNGLTFAEETNTPIQNGNPITAQIAEGTKHTYEFTTNEDGEYYIILDNTVGKYNLTLFDSDGKTISTTYNGGSNPILNLRGKLLKGSYTIQVEPRDLSGISIGSYRIKATYAASFSRNEVTFEPNETMLTSTILKNGEYTSSTAEHYLDRDVYQLTTDKAGNVYIAIDEIVGNFNFNLYDSSGNYVDHPHQPSPNGLIYFSTNVPQGTYYLYVDPYYTADKIASYRIKATFPSIFTRDKTTFEPNDTDETSMPLTSNQYYSSSCTNMNDRDFYQITTNKYGFVRVVLDNTVGLFSMWLYDSKVMPLSSYGSYGYTQNSGEKIHLNLNLDKGTYYVHVVPIEPPGVDLPGTTISSYRIKADFLDKTPSVDPVYHIDTHLTGAAENGTKVSATVGSKKLGETVAVNGKYNITIPAQKAGTVIGIYTVDEIGNISTTANTTVVDATIKAVSSSYNKIKITWNNLPGVSGYEIYRSTSSSGTYSKVGTVLNESTNTFTNNSVATGTIYYYKVRAYRTINGTNSYTSFTKNTSGKAIPATPSTLWVKKLSSNSMTLSWSKIDGASGYQIYRSTSPNGTFSLVGTNTSGSLTSFKNVKLTKGKTYYFKVIVYRTVNGKKVFSLPTYARIYKN